MNVVDNEQEDEDVSLFDGVDIQEKHQRNQSTMVEYNNKENENDTITSSYSSSFIDITHQNRNYVILDCSEYAIPNQLKINKSKFDCGGYVNGKCSLKYWSLVDVMKRNLSDGLDKGAQLVVMINDDIVVDLYSRSSSEKVNYNGNTVQNVYSAGKNLDVFIIALLYEKKLLQYHDYVCKYWPKFGQGNKDKVTISDVLKHQGGCPWFLHKNKNGFSNINDYIELSYEDLKNYKIVDKVIEETNYQVNSINGSNRIYHTHSKGLIVDGILRHVITYHRNKRSKMKKKKKKKKDMNNVGENGTKNEYDDGHDSGSDDGDEDVDVVVVDDDDDDDDSNNDGGDGDPFPMFKEGDGTKEFVSEYVFKPLGITDYHLSIPIEQQDNVDFAVCHLNKKSSSGVYNTSADSTSMNHQSSLLSVERMRFGGGISLLVDPCNPSNRMMLDLASNQQNQEVVNTSCFNISNARSTAILMKELDGRSNELSALGLSENTIHNIYKDIDYKSEHFLLNVDSIGFTKGGLCNHSTENEPSLTSSLTSSSEKNHFKGFFGWGGAGGSLCMVDPIEHITIAFCITGGSDDPVPICPRIRRILTALRTSHESLKNRKKKVFLSEY